MNRMEFKVSKVVKSETEVYSLDDEDVVSINYHEPLGEGDAHFCDVLYSDNKLVRVFRPESVTFTDDRKKEGN